MKLALTAALLAAILPPTALAQSSARQACTEAMSETLRPGTPRKLRAKVLSACLAAFKDPSHRRNAERACDKQAAKVPANERFPVAYTCTTAMSMVAD